MTARQPDALAALDEALAHAKLRRWPTGQLREARDAAANLAHAGRRVTDAFRALGTARGALAESRARQECEAAMLALDAALAPFPRP